MSGASITIRDEAIPLLDKMKATLEERQDINEAIGAAVMNECRDYVINQQPDRHETALALGANPTGFLGFAAKAIRIEDASAAGVTVDFAHPWFARVGHDVDIVPTEGKYLALPIAAESYGKRLKGNFPGGFFFNTNTGGLFYGVKIPGRENLLSPLYVLVTSVHQEQDRGRLPADDEIEKTIVHTLKDEADQRLGALP